MIPLLRHRSVLLAWVVLVAMADGHPIAAQPAAIIPAFEPERLPSRFRDGTPLSDLIEEKGDETCVNALAFSPDGSQLAVGDGPTRLLCVFGGLPPINENGGLIRIIDVATRKVIRTIRPAKKPWREYEIVSLAYTPDGRTLFAHGKEVWQPEDRGVEVGYHVTAWDPSTGRALRRIDSAKLDDWKSPTFSRDASAFAARMHAGLRVWDLATGHERPAPVGGPVEKGVPALSPDGKTLAAGDPGGEVGLWDVATGKRLARFPAHRKDGHTFAIKSLAFSPDGRMLACRGMFSVQVNPPYWQYTSEIRLIDVVNYADRATIPGSDGHVFLSLAFSPDGKSLAVASRGPSAEAFGFERWLVRIWDTAPWRERASIRSESDDVTHITYPANGSLLVTAGRDGITLRDPADGHERASLGKLGFLLEGGGIAVSPDGRTFAATNGRLRLWDVQAALGSK